MLLRVLEPASVFTAVHIDLTGKPQDHHWDVLWPLYFGFFHAVMSDLFHKPPTDHSPHSLQVLHLHVEHWIPTRLCASKVLVDSQLWSLRPSFLSVNTTVMQKVQQQRHFHTLRRNRVEQRLLMFYFITI